MWIAIGFELQKHTQKESQKSISMKGGKVKKKCRTCECENGTKLNQEKVSEVKIRLKPMSLANNACIINVKDWKKQETRRESGARQRGLRKRNIKRERARDYNSQKSR